MSSRRRWLLQGGVLAAIILGLGAFTIADGTMSLKEKTLLLLYATVLLGGIAHGMIQELRGRSR